MERKQSINSVQKDILVQFMKDHDELQSGRFTNEFTFKKAETLWEELTVTLNSVPNGAQKNWRQWRKTWQDLKKHIKSKAVIAKKHAVGTGGGEPVKPLSDIDTEILEIINPVQIDGLDIDEPRIVFDLNSEAEIEVEENLPSAEKIILDQNQEPSKVDHDYISAEVIKTPKRVNKTTRLTNSLNISKSLLTSVERRNSLLDEYYKEKISYLRNKREYLDNKHDLDSKSLSELIDIKNILMQMLSVRASFSQI